LVTSHPTCHGFGKPARHVIWLHDGRILCGKPLAELLSPEQLARILEMEIS